MLLASSKKENQGLRDTILRDSLCWEAGIDCPSPA